MNSTAATSLDVLLPTMRWNSYVEGYIAYLAATIEYADLNIRLHIGDNSCDPAKREFLEKLASPNVVVHAHATNIGLYPNLLHLFRNSNADLLLTLGDDDWIHQDTFAQAAFLRHHPECSACAGYFAAIPPHKGHGVAFFADRFMTDDPVSRSIDYVRYSLWEQAVNWLALAVHRRATMSLYVEYVAAHPFDFWFRDQMLSQIALLSGQVKGMPSGFTYYRTRSPEGMSAHLANHSQALAAVGLPPWLHHYYHYWLACEYATLYLWRGVPNTCFDSRIDAADRVFNEVFAQYRAVYDQHTTDFEDHFEKAQIWKPMYAVLDRPSAITGLRALWAIFSRTSSEAGNRFGRFLTTQMAVEVPPPDDLC